MEASCGCRHIGRQLQQPGRDVRLLPAQFVKTYVKSRKNDHGDAQAIAEAAPRPTMRFLPIKTEDQLEGSSHASSTGTTVGAANEPGESAACVSAGARTRGPHWPCLSLASSRRGDGRSRANHIAAVAQQWRALATQIEDLDLELKTIADSNEACRRLQSVPGVGPLASTAMVAAIGNGAAFQKGRQFSAWLGLVPRQCSTGGKTKLLGISRRGNEYLRRLLIHGGPFWPTKATSFGRTTRPRPFRPYSVRA